MKKTEESRSRSLQFVILSEVEGQSQFAILMTIDKMTNNLNEQKQNIKAKAAHSS